MGEVKRVNIREIGNKDATLDPGEIQQAKAKIGDVQSTDTVQIVNGNNPNPIATYDATTWNAFAAQGNPQTAGNGESGSPLPPATKTELDNLVAQIDKAEAEERKDDAQQLRGQLAAKILLAKKQGHAIPSMYTAKANKTSGSSGNGGGMSFKASTTSPGTAAQTQTMGGGSPLGFGGGATGAASSYPPAGWGAQSFSGANFSADAYMQSVQMTDNVMASWDEVGKNQNRGKQLMMLFFYFAKMAESGDMGAMYQFMKFITYIVSKDKAKQQIEMGKKLIELQDLSRSWTNKLLNLSTSSTDTNASNELMKTMTIVKSETDAIATSQKLISQMMEEFAQVVETLTNTTKSALETAGRVMRTVSRFSS